VTPDDLVAEVCPTINDLGWAHDSAEPVPDDPPARARTT
jgi:hypothetical protein